ncbi:MAG: hypothetical protein AB8C46_17785 [Burkholderiaceae bacterium]
MTKRFGIALVLGFAGIVTLAGCDDPRSKVQLHAPGKYLGPVDPLLEKSASGSNEEALKQRFASIQRDR